VKPLKVAHFCQAGPNPFILNHINDRTGKDSLMHRSQTRINFERIENKCLMPRLQMGASYQNWLTFAAYALRTYVLSVQRPKMLSCRLGGHNGNDRVIQWNQRKDLWDGTIE
jgi:hypothetical protein